ncbi:MAG TPA: hypothetical protein VJ647_03765 [Chitinophagaceae bacterium]|nr:hypothetical protein [Chitinophagaceae bacterium]
MTQKQMDNLSITERAKARTPKLFKTIRTIGIALAAVSGALLAAPVALPAIVTTIAGYLAVAGTGLSASTGKIRKGPDTRRTCTKSRNDKILYFKD